ncbi:Type 1 glutamine amidotransferase-like domain-containing protein [Bacillaceae bacterium Marseille-Q3522]|nr:Type 1 glutamine amidotransferase-like domain-containing protein [Bacillaceae bacterium Marseille-Q3522]
MGKFVAIGGGEIRLSETLPIDRYIVEFSNTNNPKLLFIPTASGDSQGYIETVKKIYGEQLGCEVDTLLLVNSDLTDTILKDKILSSNIIYVDGGDTVKMMEIWRMKKVDQYMKEAFKNNIVLSGLSAGSICWFLKGHSDSSSKTNPDGWWDYKEAIGIGLIPAIHCPHYNENGHDKFDDNMITEEIPGIAIENNCAFVIKDGMFKIIKSNCNSKAYLFKIEMAQ